mmetsp:Transcript_31689/g.58398  ORF Transcript_31689/g.58398 Transcript_31689/m.58398 type:complete len:93 (+) Transcript_31689:135-413(+)
MRGEGGLMFNLLASLHRPTWSFAGGCICSYQHAVAVAVAVTAALEPAPQLLRQAQGAMALSLGNAQQLDVEAEGGTARNSPSREAAVAVAIV